MVIDKRPDSLFVLSECFCTFACSYVPHPDHLVVGCSDNLWFISLADDVFDRVGVPAQNVHFCLGAHIPDSGCGISTSSHEQVKLWV